MPRYRTLREIDRAGFDVRVWCFACGRGADLDGTIWMDFEDHGRPLDLSAAQACFRCSGCGGRDALILPCTPRRRRPSGPLDWAVTWFFANRKAGRPRGR